MRDGLFSPISISLRTTVTDLLDGVAPRSCRIVGAGVTPLRGGAYRVARDARTDLEIENELVAQLGRIAIVEGSLRAALLAARLHNATAVTFGAAPEKPTPWPHDASLALVLYGTTSSWVADLPTLPAPT